MKLEDIVKIGEVFEVKLGELAVKTKLQEILANDHFVVFQPTFKGMPIWSDEDQIFRFAFYRSNGVYLFDAEMIDSYAQNNIQLCEFHVITDVSKNQRRECFRLPIVLDMTISLVEEDDNDVRKGERMKAKTVDLSEKSLKCTCFAEVTVGIQVIVDIKLTDMKTMTLKGVVYRVEKPSRKSDPDEIVLLFLDVSEYHRSYISRYILRQQVLMRRKKRR